MFGITFMGPVIFFVIFLSMLAWKTTEKTIEKFHGFPKYEAK